MPKKILSEIWDGESSCSHIVPVAKQGGVEGDCSSSIFKSSAWVIPQLNRTTTYRTSLPVSVDDSGCPGWSTSADLLLFVVA